jgi:hypothetical protein
MVTLFCFCTVSPTIWTAHKFLKIATGKPAETLWIGGASHIFNVLTPGDPSAQRAQDATVEWFWRTL